MADQCAAIVVSVGWTTNIKYSYKNRSYNIPVAIGEVFTVKIWQQIPMLEVRLLVPKSNQRKVVKTWNVHVT